MSNSQRLTQSPNGSIDILRAMLNLRSFLNSEGIEKGSSSKLGYVYRSVEDALATVSRGMVKVGIVKTMNILSSESGEVVREISKGGSSYQRIDYYLDLTIEYVFYTQDGSSLTATATGRFINQDTNKLWGIATSYLLKETYFKMFDIPIRGQEDVDAYDCSSAQVRYPYEEWKRPQDAIEYGMKMTGKTEQEVVQIMENVEKDENGNKAINFYKAIQQLMG